MSISVTAVRSQPRRPRKALRWLIVLVSAGIVISTLAYVFFPSPVPSKVRKEIDEAFRDAASVRIVPCRLDWESFAEGKSHMSEHVEYNDDRGVSIDGKDREELVSIFQGRMFQGRLSHIRGWDPQYAIHVVTKGGSLFDILVDFLNRNVTAGRSRIRGLPPPWESHLRNLVRECGFEEFLD